MNRDQATLEAVTHAVEVEIAAIIAGCGPIDGLEEWQSEGIARAVIAAMNRVSRETEVLEIQSIPG